MEYEKETLVIDANDKEKNTQLIQCILSTMDELNKAHKNFEFAEGSLIDFYTYQIMALQSKLDYLTRLAKSKKIEIKSIYKNVV